MPKAHAVREPSHEDQPLAHEVSGDTETSEGLPGGTEPEKAVYEPEASPQEVTSDDTKREPVKPSEATTPPPARRTTHATKPATTQRRPSGGKSSD